MSTSYSMPEPTSNTGFELVRDSEALIREFLASAPAFPLPTHGIPLPLCIPQTAVSYDAPFARGYNSGVGLSQEDLLGFVDGMNMAMIASPPLRVVDLTGMVLGFVPNEWAKVAGIGLQVIAQTGQHILSKTLSDRFLRAANERLFAPRGLSARVCTTPAMQHLLSGSAATSSSTSQKVDAVGRAVGSVLLKLPIPYSSRIVRAIADPAPEIRASRYPNDKSALIRRRLTLVEGRALPLDLEVPPPKTPEGIMDTMNAYAVKYRNYKEARKNERINRSRLVREGVIGNDWRSRRAARKAERRARRGPGLFSPLIGEREDPATRRARNADLKEHWNTQKLLWIVIMNAEKDSEIRDIAIADSSANVEYIPDADWKLQMAREEESDSSDSEPEEAAPPAYAGHN